LGVYTDNFPVEDSVLHGQLSQSSLERLESQVSLIAGNELALAVLEVDNGPETVMFQFENVVRMVKWLFEEP